MLSWGAARHEMGEHGARVQRLQLFAELQASAGRDGVDAAEIATLSGVITTAAEELGPLLQMIAQTFRQYTAHDLQHSCNLMRLMAAFIPRETRERLNALELAFLILAALFHDTGMIVSDQERAALPGDAGYRSFLSLRGDRLKAMDEAQAADKDHRRRAIEDSLAAEYYRRRHAGRARRWIEKLLRPGLRFRDVDLGDDLGDLCESHAWSFEAPLAPGGRTRTVATLPDDRRIGNVPLNLQYLSCCLRLADILDFDRSRTPPAVLELIDFTEARSWEEWNKHLSVEGWSITETEVRFETRCDHPAYYVAVHEFLNDVDRELSQGRYLIDQKPAALAERYRLSLPHVVDRRRIRMRDESYVAGGFKFSLEYEEILRLLMDKSLYPDRDIFLRELLQNALDACSRKQALAAEQGRRRDYKSRISVWDYSQDPAEPRIVFQDNGIGMSLTIVEQYFLRVGRSYYKSPEFEAERLRLEQAGIDINVASQFGIGILSCFLVADRIVVETYQRGYDPLRIEVNGPTKYFLIQRSSRAAELEFPPAPGSARDDGPPSSTGTRITLWLRPGVNIYVAETLDEFAVNCDHAIGIYESSRRRPRLIAVNRWDRLDDRELLTLCAGGVCTFSLDARWRPDSPPLPDIEALHEVLIPCRVPFGKWRFSSHLRGTVCIWLLRGGNDSPTPRRGYLEMRSGLRLAGVAALALELGLSSELGAYERMEALAALLDGVRIRTVKHHSELLWKISECAAHERRALRKYFRCVKTDVSDGDLLRSLRDGDLSWATGASFSYSYNRQNDLAVALGSIFIPGGIGRITGGEVKLNDGYVPANLGMFIDARGRSAPLPVASRLFIAEAEGRPLISDCYRAVLRYARDLATPFRTDEAWRDWIANLLGGFWGSITIDADDLAYFEEAFFYRVRERRRGIVELSRADLKRRFGGKAWISYHDQETGLVQGDLMTDLLVLLSGEGGDPSSAPLP